MKLKVWRVSLDGEILGYFTDFSWVLTCIQYICVPDENLMISCVEIDVEDE